MSFVSFLIERFIRPTLALPLVATPATAIRARMPLDQQMARVADVVSTSLERSAVTSRYHTAAENQLDAASYALKELMKDLSAVMSFPAAKPAATLHQLPASPAAPVPAPARRVSAAA